MSVPSTKRMNLICYVTTPESPFPLASRVHRLNEKTVANWLHFRKKTSNNLLLPRLLVPIKTSGKYVEALHYVFPLVSKYTPICMIPKFAKVSMHLT